MKKLTLTALACGLIFCLSAQNNLLKKLPGKVKKQLSNMVFIKSDTLYKESGKSKIKDFYMAKYEVSNGDWQKFETAMKAKYGAEKAKVFLPDTLVWRKQNNFNEPMVTHYYRHPAYRNYPLVGLSYTLIQEYIKWKNDEAAALLKANNVTGYTVTYRLPTANEMEFVLQDKYNSALKNKRGDYTCNFNNNKDSTGVQRLGGAASRMNDNADITAPVSSYWANKLGIFNIRGNVAEWTSTAIQTFAADPKGVSYICKGGSWIDGPYYLQQQTYKTEYADSANWSTGFRLVMDIVPVEQK